MFVSVEPLRRQKDTDCFVRVFCLVGVARLELAALRSRTVRATKLRYTPINMCLFQSVVARLGARRAFPLGLALSTTVSVICSYFEVYLIRFTQLFANQTALHPDILVVVNFDCLCNIHQFEHFCNKNKSIILKIMFYAIIFLSR